MKAIRLHDTNGIDALTLDEVPRPEADPEEALVRVEAAGINPADWLISRGELPHLRDSDLPWTPGWDVSGVVESVGDDVRNFKPGDAVCGMARLPGGGGAFAEYTTMRGNELTTKPASLSHVEAAALPMVGQTAYHALYEAGDLSADEKVLIHAAAGGVGHVAVQFATNTGAYVIGTASGRNEAFLHNVGVDEFVNYREEKFESLLDGVDLVIDCVGGEVIERSVEITREGGTVVTLPEPPTDEAIERYDRQYDVDVRFFALILDSTSGTLRKVIDGVENQGIRPTVSETYTLSTIPDALERSMDGHVRGKLVSDIEHNFAN